MVIGSGWRNSELLEKIVKEGEEKNEREQDPGNNCLGNVKEKKNCSKKKQCIKVARVC